MSMRDAATPDDTTTTGSGTSHTAAVNDATATRIAKELQVVNGAIVKERQRLDALDARYLESVRAQSHAEGKLAALLKHA